MPAATPGERRSRWRRARAAAVAVACGAAILPFVATDGPAVAAAEDLAPGHDAVTRWNANAAQAALTSEIAPAGDPLHESRMYAMMHIAIHDALNAIVRRSEPYAMDARISSGASPEAAVAAAARGVLIPALNDLPDIFAQDQVDDAVDGVEEDYTTELQGVPEGVAREQGIAIGEAAAKVVLAQRMGDGSDTVFLDFDYPEGDEPGEYRFPEGAPLAAAPGWGKVTPFVMKDGSQFRPPAPYDLASRQYAKDFNELKRLGGNGTTTPSARTPLQTEIALFWFESSPLMWNRIARTVSASAGVDLWRNARLFGILNMALADGYIGNWEAKQYFNRWRPETAVRLGDDDLNPRTVGDLGWDPLIPTGATPEYDSGHSIEGSAAARIMRGFFGTDRMSFSVCGYSLPAGTSCTDPTPMLRSFTSFSQAARENGESRILVGWHFRNAVEQGLQHGEKLGAFALTQFMRQVRHP